FGFQHKPCKRFYTIVCGRLSVGLCPRLLVLCHLSFVRRPLSRCVATSTPTGDVSVQERSGAAAPAASFAAGPSWFSVQVSFPSRFSCPPNFLVIASQGLGSRQGSKPVRSIPSVRLSSAWNKT